MENLLAACEGSPSGLLTLYPHFKADGAPTGSSITYLHWACAEANAFVLRGLVACGRGVNLSIVDSGGRTPLYTLCSGEGVFAQRTELAAWLLRHRGDVRETINRVGGQEWVPWKYSAHYLEFMYLTPLCAAIRAGNVALVRLLVRYGADLTDADGINVEARSYARTLNRSRIVSFLEPNAWRPEVHICFPTSSRLTIRTLLQLARLYNKAQSTAKFIAPSYPQSCLHLLPNELLHYLICYIVTDWT